MLDSLVELSPLNALDADDVDKLTARQQAFLIAFINSGSLISAKRQAKVNNKLWETWQSNPVFVDTLKAVKNPAVFAHRLASAIVFEAMKEHYKMLRHEKIGVRQWAIERAYNLRPKNTDNEDDGPRKSLSQGDIKQLAEGVVRQLSDADRAKVDRAPFQVVDAEYRAIEAPSND